jgi:hypothetical protein
MSDFQVRADAVDVEQIMRQIRARIREKRGADYTEAEIRELATVKLEKFLDPRGIRSNLVEEFRRNRVISSDPKPITAPEISNAVTHRSMLASIRNMLAPVMKLFINPNAILHTINEAVQGITVQQTAINADFHRRFRQREEMDPLYYEVIHNLVVELTRLSIENANLKMRVESLSSRMDFDERRSKALESVVQYKPAPQPGGQPPRDNRQEQRPERNDRTDRAEGDRGQAPAPGVPGATVDPQRAGLEPRDQGERGERRRRRRRRRRPGQNMAQGQGQGQQTSNVQGPGSSGANTPQPSGGPAFPGSSGSEAQASSDQGGGDEYDDGPDDGPDDSSDDQSGSDQQGPENVDGPEGNKE